MLAADFAFFPRRHRTPRRIQKYLKARLLTEIPQFGSGIGTVHFPFLVNIPDKRDCLFLHGEGVEHGATVFDRPININLRGKSIQRAKGFGNRGLLILPGLNRLKRKRFT